MTFVHCLSLLNTLLSYNKTILVIRILCYIHTVHSRGLQNGHRDFVFHRQLSTTLNLVNKREASSPLWKECKWSSKIRYINLDTPQKPTRYFTENDYLSKTFLTSSSQTRDARGHREVRLTRGPVSATLEVLGRGRRVDAKRKAYRPRARKERNHENDWVSIDPRVLPCPSTIWGIDPFPVAFRQEILHNVLMTPHCCVFFPLQRLVDARSATCLKGVN